MEHLGDVLGRDLDNLQTFVLETYVQALTIAENFLFNLAVEAEHLDLERGLVRIADCNERGIADKIEGVCTEETAGNDTLLFLLFLFFLFFLLLFLFFSLQLFIDVFHITADTIDWSALAQDVAEGADERSVYVNADFVHLPVGDVSVMASAIEVSGNHAAQELVLFWRVRSAVNIATRIFIAIVAAVVRSRGGLGTVTGVAHDV